MTPTKSLLRSVVGFVVAVLCVSDDQRGMFTGFHGVVQVHRGKDDVWIRPFGLANREWNVSMPENAQFRLASNTKLFVAVALYQLQEKGVLKVEERVSSYLDATDFAYFPEDVPRDPITGEWCPVLYNSNNSSCLSPRIVDLLSMGSGIIDITNCEYPEGSEFLKFCDKDNLDTYYYNGSIAYYVGKVLRNPLQFVPGSGEYQYTNYNFAIASYLIEKFSNQSLGDYIREHITSRLGLHDTGIDPWLDAWSLRKWPRVVAGYRSIFKKGAPDVEIDTQLCSPEINAGAANGAGGMIGTMSDLTAWYECLFDMRYECPVLSRVSRKALMQAHTKCIEGRFPTLEGFDIYFTQGVAAGWKKGKEPVFPPDIIYYHGDTYCSATGMAYVTRSNAIVAVGCAGLKVEVNVTEQEYRGMVERVRLERPQDLLARVTENSVNPRDEILDHLLFSVMESDTALPEMSFEFLQY